MGLCPVGWKLQGRNGEPAGFYSCGDEPPPTGHAPNPICVREPTATDPGKNAGSCGNQCVLEGNPIHTGTGNKYQRESDYSAGTLRLDRSYNSLGDAEAANHFGYGGPYTGEFGLLWRSNYHRLLQVAEVPNQSSVIAVRGDGHSVYYSRAADQVTWQGEADVADRLEELKSPSGQRIGWIYRPADEVQIERYNAQGQLAEIVDHPGRSTQLSYSDSSTPALVAPRAGLLIQVADVFGRSLGLRYNANAQITAVIEPSGDALRYAYDGAGNLSDVTYPDGKKTTYRYSESGFVPASPPAPLLTGIFDETGNRFATFSYDQFWHAIQSEHVGGVEKYQVSHGLDSTTIDPLGSYRKRTFQLINGAMKPVSISRPAGAGSPAATLTMTYDTNANVTSRTDFNGHKTCYAYDLSRNLETQRVEGLASNADCATALATPPSGARVIRTQWHPDWSLAVRSVEPKKITTTGYNGQGASCAPSSALADSKPVAVVCKRTEQATTDDSGSQGFAATVTGTPRTRSYTYTTFGRVLTATDPNGQATKTTYHPDDDPDLGKRGQIATVTNPVGHSTRYTDYNAHSQPTRTVDPNGLVTLLTYDLRQRLTSRKVGDELTTYRYDPVGQLTQITLPDGAELKYTYDAAHRLIGLADHKGNKIDYTLDAMGNRINEKLTDPSGALVKNIARSLDALNRVQQIQGAEP